jgi:hypothetical protein
LEQQDIYKPEHIADIEAFCTELRKRMQDATPEQQRATLETLQFKARIVVEDNEKVAYAECTLGEERLQVASTSSPQWFTPTF